MRHFDDAKYVVETGHSGHSSKRGNANSGAPDRSAPDAPAQRLDGTTVRAEESISILRVGARQISGSSHQRSVTGQSPLRALRSARSLLRLCGPSQRAFRRLTGDRRTLFGTVRRGEGGPSIMNTHEPPTPKGDVAHDQPEQHEVRQPVHRVPDSGQSTVDHRDFVSVRLYGRHLRPGPGHPQ